jgi:hypothetical protein
MAFVALVIGAIIFIAAVRGTQGDLFSALAVDAPAFVTWAAAIVTLGAIGFIPNLKPVSRSLIALILIVLVLRNYKSIVSGFTSATGTGTGTGNGKKGNVWVTSAADTNSMLSNVSAQFSSLTG